jgi:serine phosphatase RsbU (regulator of sigma subunit)
MRISAPALVSPGSADSLILTGAPVGSPLFELSDGTVLSFGGDGFSLFDPDRKTFVGHDILNRTALGLMEEERAFRSLSGGASTLIRGRGQVVEDRRGDLWFVHPKGIGMLPRPGRKTTQSPPFVPAIRSGDDWYVPSNPAYNWEIFAISSDADEVRARSVVPFDSTSPIRIRPRTNELTFTVAVPARLKDGSVAVQYTIDPVVPDWTPVSSDGTIRLIGLSPGSYRLNLRSVSASAPPSNPRPLRFTLELPFWNSAWFFVLAGITVLYGGFVAVERRVALLRARHERETETAVQQNELRMARTLQMAMLPKECPTIPGFDIAARVIPASDVGGDFYDFITDDDETRIVIGDVSGHGLTGAMVVGMARTAVRFATSAATRISRILSVANDRLREDVSKNVFIAVMYGVLHPRRRRFRYVCAGQPTPILVRDGKASFLPTGKGDRFPLGMLMGVRYREESMTFRSGDLLLLYSDGIVEAMNAQKEEFGFDRLQRALIHLRQASAASVIDGLLASVESFTDRVKQDDDITLIAVKVTDGGVS